MNITRREKEVLVKLAEGFTTIQIGQLFNTSHRTVGSQVEKLRTKMNAATQAHLIAIAFRKKIIE
jgi:DNA-binding CsgD family transcriptional regulator